MKNVIDLKKSRYYSEGKSEEVWERKRGAVWRKIAENAGRLPFTRDLVALYRFMGSPEVPRSKKALAAAGLLYFLAPFDTVTDFLPLVGYLDDAGVIAMVVAYLWKDIDKFRTPAGEKPEG
ncbi:MAG: DUF1232 domain-containing protein, partial [Candidatus Methylomirabilis sp.]|nr:DUF1232 domain-containing protein [Deltaproteobacteria bacterium]